jgi:hypothetical protein
MTAPHQTHPRQAWAHKDGKINMLPHGAQQVIRDPMTWLLIHEAFGRFGMAHDEARVDVLETLFTADAVLEVADGHGKPFSRVEGRDNMMRTFSSVIGQQTDQRRHCMTNILIERLTGQDCSALAFGVVTGAADGLILAASVYYSAELRLESDAMWRFNYFFIGMDTYAGKKPDTSK